MKAHGRVHGEIIPVKLSTNPSRRSFDQVQQVPLAVLKEEDFSAACGRPFRLRKLNSALFKLGPGCGQRIHAQCNVAKPGQFIVPPILGHTVSGVNFEPAAAGKSDQKSRWLLAVVKNFARAKDVFVPRFQPGGIWRRNRNVFDGNVHGGIKIQRCKVGNRNRQVPGSLVPRKDRRKMRPARAYKWARVPAMRDRGALRSAV